MTRDRGPKGTEVHDRPGVGRVPALPTVEAGLWGLVLAPSREGWPGGSWTPGLEGHPPHRAPPTPGQKLKESPLPAWLGRKRQVRSHPMFPSKGPWQLALQDGWMGSRARMRLGGPASSPGEEGWAGSRESRPPWGQRPEEEGSRCF